MSKSVIIVHHAGKNGERSTFDTIKKWHTNPKPNGNGWPKIGYHVVVERSGALRRGRPDHEEGAHTLGWNSKGLGICVCGNFETQPISYAQWNALIDQVTAWCLDHGIVPSATTIVGHRDKQPTKKSRDGKTKANTCPGRNLYCQIPLLREEVKRRLSLRQSFSSAAPR